MVDATDRYPSDPGNPGAALEERLRRLEQKVRAIEGKSPINPPTLAADVAFTTSYAPIASPVVSHGPTGASETVDLSDGSVHLVTQDEACTYTFTAPPDALHDYGFTMILTATGAATWPASVEWPLGVAPTLTGKCVLTFLTADGGTTWLGFLAGSGMI